MIGEHVATIFSKDAKPHRVTELFPELFEEENKKLQRREKEYQLQLHKERMRDFVERHNARLRKEDD